MYERYGRCHLPVIVFLKGGPKVQELKRVVSQNIANLRVKAHLTQYELGEKISYSDKAVSRWERGEAIPDAYVLLMMAELFGVTVDYILKDHSNEPEEEFGIGEEERQKALEAAKELEKKRKRRNRGAVVAISSIGVWALAIFAFAILHIVGHPHWLPFIYAIPSSLIVLLVFNSIWGKKLTNFFIISALMWTTLLSIYLSLLAYNLWVIFLLGIPSQIIIIFAFQIGRGKSK